MQTDKNSYDSREYGEEHVGLVPSQPFGAILYLGTGIFKFHVTRIHVLGHDDESQEV